MKEMLLEKMAHLLRVGVIRVETEEIFYYRKSDEFNLMYVTEEIRNLLIKEARERKHPYIYQDEFNVCYGVIQDEETFYLIGPMALDYLIGIQRRIFYKKWNTPEVYVKNLRKFVLQEVLQIMVVFTKLITDREYTEEELSKFNHLTDKNEAILEEEMTLYSLKEEEREEYRHTYLEERSLLETVQEGNTEEAIKRVKTIDYDVGILGYDTITHWKNLLVVGATLCARAAIEGGMPPHEAYRISGFYINKGCECTKYADIIFYRDQCVRHLTAEVAKQKAKKHTSNHTQQCIDYIHKNFKEKIHLDELAEYIGVSSSYLSRLFKKEMGICLSEYIVDVKVECAANMLKYSGRSISYIAEYVGFPTQSYMGKMFKERTGMTPKQYRDYHKPAEFQDRRS